MKTRKSLGKGISIFIIALLLLPIGILQAAETETQSYISKSLTEFETIDRSVIYWIIAEDNIDILDDSTINDIAQITLLGGNNISYFDISIALSNDMVNWFDTEIIDNDDIWNIGETITIRETYLDEIQSSWYNLRIMSNIYRPIAEYPVNIDNAPLNTFSDDRPKYTLRDGNEVKSSTAYCSTDSHDYNYTNMALSVELITEASWNSNGQYWDYSFNLNGLEKSSGLLTWMWLYVNSDNSYTIPPLKIGSYGMDETTDTSDELLQVAIIACKAAVSAIHPLIAMGVTGYEIAELLLKSPEPDLTWQNTYPWWEQPDFHNIFCQLNLQVEPNENWDINFNLKNEFRISTTEPEKYNVALDSDTDWPIGMHRHGEGKIFFDGIAPPPYEEADLIALQTWISTIPNDSDQQYMIETPEPGQEVFFHFLYQWTGTQACPSHSFQMKLNGDVQYEDIVDDLAPPYDAILACCSWTAQQDDYILFSETDVYHEIDELDENNNDEEYRFTVAQQAYLTLEPDTTYDFPDTNEGSESTPKKFILENTCDITDVVSVYLEDSGSHFKFESGGGDYNIEAHSTKNIYVIFCPQSDGVKTGRLVIEGTNNVVDCDLSGLGVDNPPDLQFDAVEWEFDFEREKIGEQSPWHTVYLENIGGGIATGNVYLPPTNEFELSGGGRYSLSHGDTMEIKVRFTPTSWGSLSSYIHVDFDDSSDYIRYILLGKGCYFNDACFTTGTQISMADGTYKNIEDVEVGDMVKSSNGDTEVLRVDEHEYDDTIIVINDNLQVTPNHPIMANGRWKESDDIHVGDIIYTTERGLNPIVVYSVDTPRTTYTGNVHDLITSTGRYIADNILVGSKGHIINIIDIFGINKGIDILGNYKFILLPVATKTPSDIDVSLKPLDDGDFDISQ